MIIRSRDGREKSGSNFTLVRGVKKLHPQPPITTRIKHSKLRGAFGMECINLTLSGSILTLLPGVKKEPAPSHPK